MLPSIKTKTGRGVGGVGGTTDERKKGAELARRRVSSMKPMGTVSQG